eukprot:CAMPEP_0204831086 /NCGR_PEP_ID=MMETSP1346-20131115/9807_1 /ASSEMBLY_ACC=CAM_ASM_000771 /TAXON_ID=215587 /ORGANISM="Aplanochytrium stocchinoi, Strain GSBS06" /LENGTH=89 /DNA_ID=CAMNT_0051961817 /DNA_START=308 /DNA_END=577 /DNA_ORIENTATION=+
MRAHEATATGVAVCKSAKVLTVFSTSKDHGCGGDAKCGCVLVDSNKIHAINRESKDLAAQYPEQDEASRQFDCDWASMLGISDRLLCDE